MKRLIKISDNELESFLRQWYNNHKVTRKSSMLNDLFQKYSYSGTAYRGLRVYTEYMQDYIYNHSKEFQTFLDYENNRTYQPGDELFDNPPQEYKDKVNQEWLKYVNHMVDKTTNLQWTSWSKTLTGIENFDNLSGYEFDSNGIVDKSDIDVVIEAQVEGIDLVQLIEDNNLDVSQDYISFIKDAEEIIVKSFSNNFKVIQGDKFLD